MVSEVTPSPKSTSATPFSFSSSLRTALAVTSGRKYFFAMAIPISLNILSMALTLLRWPMKILKLPATFELRVPTTSSSDNWISVSVENDWATAP